jgi:hypothetical protein
MRFVESMIGTWRRPGGPPAPFRFDIQVETPEPIRPFGTVVGAINGTVDVEGLATGASLSGTIEVSPITERRVRYTFEFPGDDGHSYRFDGWKSISWLHALHTWTTLPGTVYDSGGSIVGTADARFPIRETGRFLASMRTPTGHHAEEPGYEARRWDGKPGRIEVWYDTFTDPVSDTGFWLHHEIVAPTPRGAAEAHGWIGVFPPGETPLLVRFGPAPVSGGKWFTCDGVVVEPRRRWGSAASVAWDLTHTLESRPLFTTPRFAWQHELLPSAHVVPSPTERFSGTVSAGDRTWRLEGAPGAAARIYGHRNARRWAWLHADLGDGDVLEVVAAVTHGPALSRLQALPLVQLRLSGEDWPSNPLLAATRFRASIGLPNWTVTGRLGERILRLTVHQDPDASVKVAYRDPDGATATCTNSERADAHVILLRRSRDSWAIERRWHLKGTAHSEVGTRP